MAKSWTAGWNKPIGKLLGRVIPHDLVNHHGVAVIVEQDIANVPTIGQPRRLFAVGIHADDTLLDVLPGGTLAHFINGVEQLARTMKTPGHVSVAISPHPAHVG